MKIEPSPGVSRTPHAASSSRDVAPASFELSETDLRRRNSLKWTKYPPDVLPAWVADMDFRVAEPIQRCIWRATEASDFGYPSEELIDGFAAAFVERMRTYHGWEARQEHVVPVTDLVQALTALVSVFSKSGDAVVVQTPIYPPFLGSVRNVGRSLIECPIAKTNSSATLDIPRLRETITPNTRMLLLCNPHNPLGIVISRTDLEAIGEIADAHDLIVVADEIHADLTYVGRHIPFESVGAACAKRAITISSATKAFNIAGLRAGVMHFGSPHLLEKFRRAFPDRLLGQVSTIGMQATIAAWSESQDWLDRVLAQLRQNRDYLVEGFRRELPEIGVRCPDATCLMWLDCTNLGLEMAPDQFFLQHAKVALNGGSSFGAGFGEFVRLNFGTSPAILSEILARMAGAVRGRMA